MNNFHLFKMYLFNFLGFVILHIQLTFSSPLNGGVISNYPQKSSDLRIPNGFLLGAGTSAFQTEGAWNSHGKGESYIDYVMHQLQKDPIVNANVASDSYHHFKEDVKILKSIGLNIYRFSISWPRLLPTGYTDNINEEGVQHYHKVLDELLENGIEPFVLLHHFDHPSALEEYGGWLNETMIDAFGEYARFVFQEYGHKVKKFVTFNEPNQMSLMMYAYNWFDKSGTVKANLSSVYLCAHNLLKAHAEAYHIYNEEFRAEQNGMLGVDLACTNYIPKNPDDQESPEIAFQFNCGWFGHPIFTEFGDYPEIVKKQVYEASLRDGLEESRLPTFSQEWIDRIRGSADFFGLNHYLSQMVEPRLKYSTSIEINLIAPESNLNVTTDPDWYFAPNGYAVIPEGIRPLLRKIKQEYNNPPVYIVENGYANKGSLQDNDRINFIYSFLKEILLSIKYDKCNVKSYMYWSLIDSYEFDSGFNARFGLARVDFDDPQRKRTSRKSANWLRNVIKSRKLYM